MNNLVASMQTKQYKEFFEVNKNFQTSINLEFDLNNEQKIREYIPTVDICDVLSEYFESFLMESSIRSTVLLGPYGKGKSFLILILAYLTSGNYNSTTYIELVEKLANIKPSLKNLINRFNENKLKFLPVLINANFDDINQALYFGLNEALNGFYLTELIPNTSYSVAIGMVQSWLQNDGIITKLNEIVGEENLDLSQLTRDLKFYNALAYEKFKRLYRYLSLGIEFNPLVNNDVIKSFSDVNYSLHKCGFSGLFVVFDEFSKYLEASQSVNKSLKLLQDFAELCNRSSINNSINFCCITHKSFELYSNDKTQDSFKTVAGRFKEIRFNRNIYDNYQLVTSSFFKTDEGIKVANEFFDSHLGLYSKMEQLPIFSEVDNFKKLSIESFPFNPISIFILFSISEIVAQNERTLFTFICDSDQSSFSSFLLNNNSGLFDPSNIYDYFNDHLRICEDNRIREIWYKAESLLGNIQDFENRKIIKLLALIFVINQRDRLSPDELVLSLSLMIDRNDIDSRVAELEKNHYIRKNPVNGQLSFATFNSKLIESKVEIIEQTKISKLSTSEILNSSNLYTYLLPRRYNAQNKITRFFRKVFLEDKQYFNLNSFGVIKSKYNADGLVLSILTDPSNLPEVVNKYKEIKDDLVIVEVPERSIPSSFNKLVKRFEALNLISKDNNLDEIVLSEIGFLIDDCTMSIKSILDFSFSKGSYISVCGETSTRKYSVLSDVLNHNFSKNIVFNNELANKNHVSTQYQKAINNVCDWILSGKTHKDFKFSETSPENTVRQSVIETIDLQPDVREIIETFKDLLILNSNNHVSMASIVSIAISPPYGIRKGILPLLLSELVFEMAENVTLYFGSKEIHLNGINLSKAVYNSEQYYIKTTQSSQEQVKFVTNLLLTLNGEKSPVYRDNVQRLYELLRQFFYNLPRVERGVSNLTNIPTPLFEYKDYFYKYDINPTDLVLQKSLELFNNSYEKALNELTLFFDNWSSYVDSFKDSCVKSLKNQLNIDTNSSLKMGLSYIFKDYFSLRGVLDSLAKKNLLDTIKNLSYDDFDAYNQLCIEICGLSVEDWTNDRSEQINESIYSLFVALKDAKDSDDTSLSIEQYFNEFKPVRKSSMGKLLSNNIASVLTEFNDSVSDNEKISILVEELKKYL